MNQPPFAPHLPNIARIPHPREVERLKTSIKKLQNMVRVTIFGVVALTTVGVPAGVMGWYKYFQLQSERVLEHTVSTEKSTGLSTIPKSDRITPSFAEARKEIERLQFSFGEDTSIFRLTFTSTKLGVAEAIPAELERGETAGEKPPQATKKRILNKKVQVKKPSLNTLIEELGGVEIPVQKLINYLYRTTRDRNLPVEAQGNYEKAKARAKELGLEMSDLAGHKDTSIGEYLKSKKKTSLK